ncbi:pyruvate formate-lyase-activating protein [Trichococcus shcherbakoviae]|uniref:Pyruvate formate-lyase-activating enzyme n=1 Tax=Trichococcus shcherbakoviae TaxID=2094020 RepID=A0A383TFF3_9LACT|nr:pyruvate formate-lyase-activating protein [Trichococcus shcherbakoviae]OUL09509.1 pyruvate formate-lyase 1-activating enzyme [Sedimentibacter sp. SX930]SYZ78394.1 radical sam [Trichococcus shcherbakoviae]
MTEPLKGFVHSTESFGSVDGPGIRFIIFMQGCRMRCQFCHNPDTWNIGGGNEMTSDELLNMALQYKPFWGQKGGITVSGGEPLLQIDFLIELFTKAKAQGVHTTLDTCGLPFTYDEPFFSQFNKLLAVTDLILLDIKHIDSQKHKELTMWPNESIIELAKYLSEINKPIWVRHVLIPERTDYDDFLIRLDAFLKTLKNIVKVEILPYHKMGVYKWQTLGIPYQLEGIDPPTAERVENARKLLHTEDYKGYLDL